MKRPALLAACAAAGAIVMTASAAHAQRRPRTGAAPAPALTQVLGRPTDASITLNVLASKAVDVFVEYGSAPGEYTAKTTVTKAESGKPVEIEIGSLRPDTRYYYRLRVRETGAGAYREDSTCSFHTQRAPGSTFTFGLQGDSHPERDGRMYDAGLYVRTMSHVQRDNPDFYVALGDDFSIERLISQNMLTQANVNQVYADQRPFLGLVGRSAPLFLVNGNHEEAARFLLDGTSTSAPVLAARARNAFYPLPAPDAFYTGDAEPVEHVGLLRDYYAWTWGDALFVVIAYQEVPQPGHVRGDATGSAEEYGYRTGTLLGSSGHLRVTVGTTSATVEYVKSRVAGKNGEIVDRYELKPAQRPALPR